MSRPTPPFVAAGGALEVHQVPVWEDNLVWVVVCKGTGRAAAVDGPEAGPVREYAAAHGITLSTIFNTHTHMDHVGINHDLERRGLLAGFRVVGPKLAAKAVPGITEAVDEGDVVKLGEVEGRILRTEGHIDGHISYLFDDVLFCGDTMFAAGCGYLFDGPPEKMHASLSRFADLDPGTRVCCAHEYTQDNLRFAWSVEPDNADLADRIARVWKIRGEGGCVVPSTIGEERNTNPFLRHHSKSLVDRVRRALPDAPLDTPAQIFAATRALKDRKDYRSIPDADLPI